MSEWPAVARVERRRSGVLSKFYVVPCRVCETELERGHQAVWIARKKGLGFICRPCFYADRSRKIKVGP